MKASQTYTSFKKLFEKHYSELCSLAYNYLKDLEKSKDVVQEVYIKVWEKKQNLITEKNAHYYLFTSVKNSCIDILRKHKYTLSLSDETVANTLADDETYDNDDEDENITVQEFIKKALEELPPKCKLIFMMSRFDNMTYKEIAEKLNLSVKTVENQMGKAIRIMREYLKKHKLPKALFLIIVAFLENK
ncbi:RNA polymerase sigma-70 factor [Aquimarina longa]|uniref:RNA polymerase sigma-70 factor n=1 Tax=Aquimarina longa TaxID=1080221 RepID=UPI000781D731|nr:RNA polymerase sigma-70 factor [Aquimarina longa]